MKRPTMTSFLRTFARIDRHGYRQILASLVVDGYADCREYNKLGLDCKKTAAFYRNVQRYKAEWTAVAKEAMNLGIAKIGNEQAMVARIRESITTQYRSGLLTQAATCATSMYLTELGNKMLRDMGYRRMSLPYGALSSTRAWVTRRSKFWKE